MKIVFTAKGKEWNSPVDPRFGRTEYFFIYDDEKNEVSIANNADSSKEAHGAGPKTAQKLFDLNADVLITGNGPGENAATVLNQTGLKIYVGAGDMTIKDAYDAFKNDKLPLFKAKK
ncbi:MAG: dinitrogenase iron-molybdenum cofactor biosynthesis protein [Chlorobi bacterium]|nr:dinitrogenase iron-molybdenum cofactor biosynthesis protein [Chlorobiota bacterium]